MAPPYTLDNPHPELTCAQPLAAAHKQSVGSTRRAYRHRCATTHARAAHRRAVQVSVPQGSDEAYVEKMHGLFEGQITCYSKPPRARAASAARSRERLDAKEDPQFCVHHFADKVVYNARGWLEKNGGGMPTALAVLVQDAGNSLVRALPLTMTLYHHMTAPSHGVTIT